MAHADFPARGRRAAVRGYNLYHSIMPRGHQRIGHSPRFGFCVDGSLPMALMHARLPGTHAPSKME